MIEATTCKDLLLVFLTENTLPPGNLQHKTLLEKNEKFGGAVSESFNQNTTHVLFPRGVDYHAGIESLKSIATPIKETVALVTID